MNWSIFSACFSISSLVANSSSGASFGAVTGFPIKYALSHCASASSGDGTGFPIKSHLSSITSSSVKKIILFVNQKPNHLSITGIEARNN